MNNSYLQSIAKSTELLRESNIFAHRNSHLQLPANYVTQVRNLNYDDQWKIHNDQFWYHIKLSDQSLIFFKEDSFKYLMSPYGNLMSFQEFEDHRKQELFDEGITEEEEITIYLDNINFEYQQYLDSDAIKRMSTPIRLDIHPEQYNAAYHPMTHLHVGHDNESRIPVKKIMTPFAFTGFILSSFYPAEWKLLIEEQKISDADFKLLNQSLDNVPHKHRKLWCPDLEEHRFYLA